MNWDQIKGDWHQLSRRLKEKWKKLTDADLKSIAGRRDELEGVLQERYGYNKDAGRNGTRQVYNWADVVRLLASRRILFCYWRKTMHDPKDDRITQQSTTNSHRAGFASPCRLAVQTANGQVTLSGIVQYAHQKGAAVSAISGMTGVRRVIDQMTVKPAANRQ